MDVNDLIAANAPMAGNGVNGPTLAIGDAPAMRPPIKIPTDLPASSVPSAKAAYRKTGAYTDAEIDAAFAGHVPDTTQGPVYSGVSASDTAKGLQHMLDHGNPALCAHVLAEAARQGVQLRDTSGNFLPKADGTVPARTYDFQVAGLPGVSDIPVDELQAFLGEMGETAASLNNLPDQIANQLCEAIIRAADVYDDTLDAEAAEAKIAAQGRDLQALSNGKEILRLAGLAEMQIKSSHPEFYATLRENGAFLTVQSQLALAAVGSHIERSKRA